MLVKSPNDRSKCRQIDLLEFATRGVQLIEQTQEMIRRASNGNGREPFHLGNGAVLEVLLRGESEEQTQVLAPRKRRVRAGPEKRAQIRRREKLQTERGLLRVKESRLQRLHLTARRHDDDRRPFCLPGACRDVSKPPRNPTLPRRVRGGSEEQRGTARWLKF